MIFLGEINKSVDDKDVVGLFTETMKMINDSSWPFDVDLTALDTGSITNILNDIENHLPLMETAGDLTELLRVKELFEAELMQVSRVH